METTQILIEVGSVVEFLGDCYLVKEKTNDQFLIANGYLQNGCFVQKSGDEFWAPTSIWFSFVQDIKIVATDLI